LDKDPRQTKPPFYDDNNNKTNVLLIL